MTAEISFCDLPCLFYCMEGEFEHISRNSVWALWTKTINCSVGFIDFYSLFHTNLRIVLPPHNVKRYFYSIGTVERSLSYGRPLPQKYNHVKSHRQNANGVVMNYEVVQIRNGGGGGRRGFCGLVQMGWGWYLFVYQKIGGCIKFEVATWNHYPSASYLTVLLLFLLLFF